MSLSPTVRATLLDDLRLQLLPVADDADPAAAGDAEAWIGGGELYVAIRLCLLARDGRHAPRHGSEAECLFGLLVAYAERGATWAWSAASRCTTRPAWPLLRSIWLWPARRMPFLAQRHGDQRRAL